jgi:hypothetical protein
VSDGTWLKTTIQVAKAFAFHNRTPLLLKEIPTFWNNYTVERTNYNQLCNELIRIRNSHTHDNHPNDTAYANRLLDTALPIWENLFNCISPLIQYRLFYLERIDDFAENDQFDYDVRWLMGNSLIPRSEKVRRRQKLSKKCLYLESDQRPMCLELSPFLAYEFTDVTNTREAYCISQIKKGRLTFQALRFSGKAELPNHQQPIFTSDDSG